MTQITFGYSDNLCSFVELNGHANYADKGHDIVCSGITTSVYTSINLIDKLEKDCYELNVNDEKGYLSFKIDYQKVKKENKLLLSLIMENMIDMLKEIQNDYPRNLKIKKL